MKGALWTLNANVFGKLLSTQILPLLLTVVFYSQVRFWRCGIILVDIAVTHHRTIDSSLANEHVKRLFGCQHNEKVSCCTAWNLIIKQLNGLLAVYSGMRIRCS